MFLPGPMAVEFIDPQMMATPGNRSTLELTTAGLIHYRLVTMAEFTPGVWVMVSSIQTTTATVGQALRPGYLSAPV
jgi:hypothetical protein